MENAERSAYQEKMEAKLAKMKADIDRLEAELAGLNAGAKVEASKRIEDMRARFSALKGKMGKLKAASGAAWSETKDGVAAAWHELTTAFESAGDAFKRQ